MKHVLLLNLIWIILTCYPYPYFLILDIHKRNVLPRRLNLPCEGRFSLSGEKYCNKGYFIFLFCVYVFPSHWCYFSMLIEFDLTYSIHNPALSLESHLLQYFKNENTFDWHGHDQNQVNRMILLCVWFVLVFCAPVGLLVSKHPDIWVEVHWLKIKFWLFYFLTSMQGRPEIN